MKGGKFGYIDHTGSFVIRPIYDYAYDFSEGYAVVGIGSRYEFINKHGAALRALSYGFARAFSDGLAAVAPNDKWGFIDKSGALAIPPIMRKWATFRRGLRGFDKREVRLHKHARRSGVPAKYYGASDFWDGMAEVIQNATPERGQGVRTIIDTAGTPVLLGKK